MTGRRDIDCRAFEALLDDLLSGGLPLETVCRAEDHLAACDRCRELRDIALMNQDLLAGGEVVDQTEAILALTSGSACNRAHQLLPDLVDGLLPEADRELVAGHLEHCPDCAALAGALAWTAPALSELAVLEPPAELVDGVLAATSGRVAPRAGWRTRAADLEERLLGWWERVSSRPRFSFEAAYIGAVLLAALFATPISPLKEAPPKALELIQAGPTLVAGDSLQFSRTLPGRALSLGREAWESADRGVSRAHADVDASLTSRGARARPAWDSARGNLGGVGRALRDGDLVLAASHLSSMRHDLARAWRLWWRGPAPLPESS